MPTVFRILGLVFLYLLNFSTDARADDKSRLSVYRNLRDLLHAVPARAEEPRNVLDAVILSQRLRLMRDEWDVLNTNVKRILQNPALKNELEEKLKEASEKVGFNGVNPMEYIHALQFVGTVGYGLDWHGRLHKSTDGGMNWRESRLPLALPFIGKKLQSLDYSAPSALAFRSMHFMTEQEGLIVGGSGVIRTTDGGKTWDRDALLQVGLLAVTCSPRKHCWTAGSRPKSVYSYNPDSKKWAKQNSPSQGAIKALNYVGEQTVMGVSSLGEVIRTTDYGKTWKIVYRKPGHDLWGIDSVESKFIWVVGEKGLILHSPDGGNAWVDQSAGIVGRDQIEADDIRLHAVKFATSRRGWAAGLLGIVLRTLDGGQTWEPVRFEGRGRHLQTIYALHVDDPFTVWTAGNAGNIFASVDAGDHWFPMHGPVRAMQEQITPFVWELVKRSEKAQ